MLYKTHSCEQRSYAMIFQYKIKDIKSCDTFENNNKVFFQFKHMANRCHLEKWGKEYNIIHCNRGSNAFVVPLFSLLSRYYNL